MSTKSKLTNKEEQIMNLYWEHGAQFIKEILEFFPEPKPHFNTVSTMVRDLEKRGFLSHESFGGSHRYFPTISKEQHRIESIKLVIDKFYSSPISVVSSLVKDEAISVDELKELIDLIEKGN